MIPAVVRHLVYPLHEKLRLRETFDNLRELERTQWYSADQLHALQTAKLRALLEHAFTHCPYYGRYALPGAADPTADDPWDILAEVQPLTKTAIREHRSDMIWHDAPGGLHESVTGGSTGEPLRFIFDRRRQGYDKAARMRTHRWFGVDVGGREVYLWGSPIEARLQDRVRSWRDRLTNELLLNAFDLTPERMSAYLERIQRFNPASIFGYPSSLALLARHGRASGRDRPANSLRAVFAAGELLDPHDRDDIAAFFGAPVANGYGSREAGFIAHDCPQGSMHVTDENVIVEILSESGRPLPAGEVGEVVVTHLDAYAMPMIRYRTGDMGRHLAGPCACGRGLSRMEIVGGRRTDHLVGENGRMLHGLSLIYLLRSMDSVRQFQIHQDAARAIDISVVPAGRFEDADRRRIQDGAADLLGPQIPVSVRPVPHIECTASGKFRCVTSEAAVMEAAL